MKSGDAFVGLCLVLLATGCAMDGVRHVRVVNAQPAPVNGILVLPLYTVSSGIGVGAEGKGPHSEQRVLIEEPFLFNSGEDLMAKQLHTRGVVIPIPPFVFIGKSRSVGAWLFLKKDYSPRALQRSDILGETPIVLTNSSGNACAQAIDTLLLPDTDQQALKKLFNVEWMHDKVHVNLNGKAKGLLDAQR